MSKIKRYAVELMGEDGFQEYLETPIDVNGEKKDGKRN